MKTIRAKCSRCGVEVDVYCSKCRVELGMERRKEMKERRLFPVLYVDLETGAYYAGCRCYNCPCNVDGICSTAMLNIEAVKRILHEWDGDNIVHQVCG